MKKIYASMLALACAVCVNAQSTLTPLSQELAPMTVNKSVGKALDVKMPENNNPLKSRAADEWIELGTGYLYECIFGEDEYEVTIEQSATDPTQYRIPDAWTHMVGDKALPLYIDATDPECVVIPIQETGLVYSDAGPAEIFSYSQLYLLQDATLDDMKEYEPEKCITFENDVLLFPAQSMLITYPEYSEDIYYANDDDMYTLFPNAPIPPQWGETVESEMLERCFSAMFLDPEEFNNEPVSVMVQMNNWVEGVYRVIDPWKNICAALELDLYVNPFKIDCTDPSCVIAPYQGTGISVGDRGLTFVANECGMFYDSIENFFADPDHSDPWTYVDGVVNIPAPYGVFWNWPQWGDNGNHAYYSGESLESWIKIPEFTGISSVKNDNLNTTPTYYNIYGMQVANPIPGQLYIVKSGNEVKKVIVK